jgi:hypothetical protein
MELKPGIPVNIDTLGHRASPDYKRAYTNNVSLAANFFDASVTFGEIVFDRIGEGPYIEDHITISMSWEHMKALYEGIGKLVQGFEESNKIKIREVSTAPPFVPRP